MSDGAKRIACAAAGDRGLLIQDQLGGDLGRLAPRARLLPGVEAAISGHSSLLVLLESGSENLRRELAIRLAAAPIADSAPSRKIREIRVSFEESAAPDLPRLIEMSGLTRERLIEAIARLDMRVRFLGFLPGFAYLDGWPAEWQLPRLDTPRARVPAGSFAVAGPSAGFYPDTSPGGWNLLGRSDTPFWDPLRLPPNLLSPGDQVRIVPGPIGAIPRARVPVEQAAGDPAAEVIAPGTLSISVGPAHPSNLEAGAFPGGPFDVEAAAVANRAVGNPPDAAVLECALSGPRLRFLAPASLSWTGAAADIVVDGSRVPDPRVIAVNEGSLLAIGKIGPGARGWLAISGGWGIAELPGLSPVPLRAGQILTGGERSRETGRIRTMVRELPTEILAIAGPASVDAGSLEQLRRCSWTATDRMDRTGVRLVGAGWQGERPPASLPSTPLQFGSVQWHPDGSLLVMGPDHPVTGGYLQVMTIPSSERWKIAQLGAGAAIRWRIEPPIQYA
ncbi:MAG: carboxyltransferase domain-containing protein [Thermoanaerobaculia bacterium]